MAPEILSISRLLVSDSGDLAKNWMSNLGASFRQMKWDISFGYGASKCAGGPVGIGDYELAMMHLKRIDNVFGNNNKHINFNYRSHKLNIYVDWAETFAVDEYIMCDAVRIIDPEEYGDIWSDEWLIEYGTALLGRQWGANLSKFAGVELPGGITLDGDKIYDRYHERYLELRQEMQDKYEEPVDFFVG